jgi:hypothetical protein
MCVDRKFDFHNRYRFGQSDIEKISSHANYILCVLLKNNRVLIIMDPNPADFLEIGPGTPSFSCPNHTGTSSVDCLDIGTGTPPPSSLLTKRGQVDDRHQPSYSIACFAASSVSVESAQYSIEESFSFPFSSSKTSFCMVGKRSEPKCEHLGKRQYDPLDSGWRRAREQQYWNSGNRFHQEEETKGERGKRRCIIDSKLNCSQERCSGSQDSQHDSQQPAMEAYSLGSGDPRAYPPS